MQKYYTMEPMREALSELLTLIKGIESPEMNAAFMKIIKAFTRLEEDVNFLHKTKNELEDDAINTAHKKFKNRLFAAMAKDPKYKDLI